MAQLTNGDIDPNGEIDPDEEQTSVDRTMDTTFDGIDGNPMEHNISADTGDSCEGGVDSSKQNGSSITDPSIDRYGFIGGNQYTDPNMEQRLPVELLRKRELKWLDMMENWEKWMSKRFKKVKERCRKGIPSSLRARSWQYLCGSKFLLEHNRHRYQELVRQPGDPKCIDDIEKDLHRQFPFHEMFMAKSGNGQEDLFNVLKAYTIHNPVDGYCQAQAPIAAVLLMHMPAEQAFWCMVSICEKYLPGYYSAGLEAVKLDGDVLNGLLKRTSSPIYKHLKKQRCDPILYMTEWFMCLFSRTLPWASVLRVWDMFFCEGVKVMFRVALVLIRSMFGKQEQLDECPDLYDTLTILKKIPEEYTTEEYLITEVNKLSVTERDMEREHQSQLAKRRQAREKAAKEKAAKEKAAREQDTNNSNSKTRKKHHKSPPNSPTS